MAESSSRRDPFLAFRFEVRISGLSLGGFSECTGLGLETEVEEYAEGGLNTHLRKFPGRTKQTNLTLKAGVADRVLHDWYTDLVAGRFERRDGSLLLHEPDGGAVVAQWEFVEAFPSKWTGPDLNATQSAVAVETLEICHEGLRRTT